MQRFRRTMLATLIVVAGALVMALSLSGVLGQTRPQQADCVNNTPAYPGPSSECREIGPTDAILRDRKATEMAVSIAHSQTEGARPRPTMTEMPAKQRTEAAIWVPGSVPVAAQTVKPLKPGDSGGIPGLRYANSIWHIGGVPSSSPYDYITIVALAKPVRDGELARIAIVPVSNSLTQDEWDEYFRTWPLPTSVERVEITGFDKLVVTKGNISGILHFETSDRVLGDLNLSTGEITMNTVPVEATPTLLTATSERNP
jgi:hypothetical protein